MLTRFAALALTIATLAPTFAEASIISGPEIYNGHTYYLLDTNTWTASEAEALTLGGHLVTINDLAENRWVFETFNGATSALWIGLTDQATEGTFLWASGEAVAFTNWNVGFEPNNNPVEDPINGEDYVHMFNRTDEIGGRWNDLANAGLTFGPKYGVVEVNADASGVVPEPASCVIWGALGLLGLATSRRRKQRV